MEEVSSSKCSATKRQRKAATKVMLTARMESLPTSLMSWAVTRPKPTPMSGAPMESLTNIQRDKPTEGELPLKISPKIS